MKVKFTLISSIELPNTTPIPNTSSYLFEKEFDAVGFAYNSKIEKMCAICTDEKGEFKSLLLENLTVVK